MKRRGEVLEIQAPPCAVCATAPAVVEARIEVRGLVLDRDAGMKSRPYWRPDYQAIRASASCWLCSSCLASQVNVSTSMRVELEAVPR